MRKVVLAIPALISVLFTAILLFPTTATAQQAQMPMTGQGQMPMMRQGQMPMMGPMGSGMMGQGQMPMMCPGMGMMMGQGPMPMMGHMGPGMMMGQAMGNRVVPVTHLSTEDVRHFLEHRLSWQGYKRLKVGTVEEKDSGKIVAEIVTADGSLVQRFAVDRHTGVIQDME